MIDMVLAVDDPEGWHAENMARNPGDYHAAVRLLGPRAAARLQTEYGARVYYNPYVSIGGLVCKYGVIKTDDLLDDLRNWTTLYVAGRMHKPVDIVSLSDHGHESVVLSSGAHARNLRSALHAALLMLPERFDERALYRTIAGMSYMGDVRVGVAEHVDKVGNIVGAQGSVDRFRQWYAPAVSHAAQSLIHVTADGTTFEQDLGVGARRQLLSGLPSNLIRTMVACERMSLQPGGGRGILTYYDPSSCLEEDVDFLIRREGQTHVNAPPSVPCFGAVTTKAITSIVRHTSVAQAAKGVLTGGPIKSLRYFGEKVFKFAASRL